MRSTPASTVTRSTARARVSLPEIGKVWNKYGGNADPESTKLALKTRFQAQPTGIDDRHQMPQFKLSDQDLSDLIDFLRWTSDIDTQGWPAKASK